ncbi:MAG: alpha-amylase/4-alpha-glucanotransferase domain-containing protein [Candidatus Omnitrophota bacterium]
MNQVNFLMGLHCHQPVDNFTEIFENAYERSYEPFLSVLERHSGVKVSFHYSGSLLEWLIKARPSFVARIRDLVQRGQVEILTAGYFEPILSMIPSDDAIGQVEMLTRTIRDEFSCSPQGIWLSERVWDPSLIPIMKALKVKYTILDDFHLKCSGKRDEDVFGYYSVKGVDDFYVFASIKKLRYTMPFRQPQTSIDFLKEQCDRRDGQLVTFADDCEKFGFWPHTYDWVFKKGWLDKFFTLLETSSWIRTMTFTEALSETQKLGEIDIPHSSYEEMFGWCKGNFNNFFEKYPESKRMKERMLSASRRIKNMAKEARSPYSGVPREDATKELYKAQSNCAYWHGVFGGVYTRHLRQGVYKHLICADKLIKGDNPDGSPEITNYASFESKSGYASNAICIKNRYLSIFLDPDHSAAAFEIDYKPLSYNLVNTMSRRIEPYHEKLKKRCGVDLRGIMKKIDKDQPVDLYDALGIRERNLKNFLNYDPYQKLSLICHAMDQRTSIARFVESRHADLRNDSLLGPHNYKVTDENGRIIINLSRDGNVDAVSPVGPEADNSGRRHALRINKCIILERGSEIFMKFDLENISGKEFGFIFGIEFNWSVQDDWFMRKREMKHVSEVALTDKFCGIKISHAFEEPVDVWSFPVYTVNESDKGLYKSFQEISMLFHKKLFLGSGQKLSLKAKVGIWV